MNKQYLICFLEKCGIGKIEGTFSEEIENKLEEFIYQKIFRNASGKLNAEILKCSYTEVMSYSEISKKYGITEKHTQQIINTAENLMKSYMTNEEFIRLLANCCIRISGSETARLLDDFLKQQKQYEPYRNIYLEDMELSARTYNALTSAGYLTAEEILRKNTAEIKQIKGFGRKNYLEFMQKIEMLNNAEISVHKLYLEENYPSNLLSDCCAGKIEGTFSPQAVKQIETVIVKKLNSRHNARNMEILIKHYRNHQSMSEIAVQYDITRENVRHILMHCIQNIKSIIYKQEMLSLFYEEEKAENIRISDFILEKMIAEMQEKKENMQKRSIDEMPISVRARNALKRSGYVIVEELLSGTVENLKGIRYLGNKCLMEISEVLIRDYGADKSKWTL